MLLEKKAITSEEVEAQAAFELPNRDMMLVTIVLTNVLNNLSIDVDVKNNKVAVQVCAVVQALNAILTPGSTTLTCNIQQ